MDFNASDDDVELPVPPVAQKTEKAIEQFAPLLQDDFRQFKRNFLEWLTTEGKDPLRGEGYSPNTIRGTHYRIEQVYRWMWNRDGEYSRQLDPEDATEFIEYLLKNTEKEDTQIYSYEKALNRLFKFIEESSGREVEWEQPYDLKTDTGNKNLD